ncbi:hypothetical protein [Agrobacterium salinitolerans]|uniref:hypothetical protein n=1 Tax=Agrobacterium salinitolerans TaxID=1183413 RepID=UPI00174CA9C1
MIVVDVGANRGDFVESCLAHTSVSLVHAIDPLPSNCKFMRERFSKGGAIGRVVIHETAVSMIDKPYISFNISNDEYGEVSSVLEVSEFVSRDPYWSSREDLQHFHTSKVANIFATKLGHHLGFARDDVFLKVDAQGLDVQLWNALQHQVVCGVVEVSAAPKRSLYKGATNSLEELFSVLSGDFEVYDLLSNDPNADELNVFLIKKGYPDDFLCTLVYGENSFFSEKRNWVSSSAMRSACERVEQLGSRIQQLENRVVELELRNRILEERNEILEERSRS